MSEKIYRTAIYARLSKDDGDKAESNSITSQKAICEEYITGHSDLELVETFVDDGYSGVSFHRPQFEQMEQAMVKEFQVFHRSRCSLMAADVKAIKKEYPKGCRVRLQRMDDEQAPPAGTEGTVRFVDDMGQIHVAWDNGSSLALLYPVDDFEKVGNEA